MTQPHFYKDKWGLILVKGDHTSYRDCMGRNFEDEVPDFELGYVSEAMESCLWRNGNKWGLKRHPEYDEETSRDHWSYFIMYRKATMAPFAFKKFIKDVPRMRGMNLWKKSLKGNKWAQWWYYTIFNPGARIGNALDTLITRFGNLGPEESLQWWVAGYNGDKMLMNLTPWQEAWRSLWQLVIPFFPTQNRAWQLSFLPEHKRKEIQQRILLRRTDRGNIIVRLLLGDDHISVWEINGYQEVTGDRSGVKLNKSCDRTIHLILNTANCYKKKLIEFLYFNSYILIKQ
jgi:hypothetical protein